MSRRKALFRTKKTSPISSLAWPRVLAFPMKVMAIEGNTSAPGSWVHSSDGVCPEDGLSWMSFGIHTLFPNPSFSSSRLVPWLFLVGLLLLAFGPAPAGAADWYGTSADDTMTNAAHNKINGNIDALQGDNTI